MPSLGDRIVEHLTTKGASLDDAELAEALGVHRPVIAETCRQLEAQGLVVRNMSGGTRPVVAAVTSAAAGAGATPPAAAPVQALAPLAGPTQSTFPAHARRVLSARWGSSLQRRQAVLAGGTAETFELVSGNGRIVGDVVWLADRGPSYEAKAAAIAEAVFVVSHAANADRRFLVFGEEWDVVTRWLARYRALLDGVEVWVLAGDKLERLA